MKRLAVIFSALLVVLSLVPAFAQEKKPTVTGSWKCVAMVNDQRGEFQLDLVQKGAEVSGTATRSDGSTDIQKGSFENGKLKLNIEADGGEYALEATLDGQTLKGELSHSAGFKGTWEAKRAGAEGGSVTVAGAWKLMATVGGQTVEYKVELKQDGENYSGSIYTADGEAIPLSKISFKDNVLKFTVSAPDGDYNTESKFDGKSLKGTFTTPNGDKGTFEATKS